VTGDFTSVPLRDGDPWTGALLQQGRVLLDGDWNLNVEAAARERQRLALQAVGPAGVLQGTSGFKIGFADGTLQIGAGSMWIGGLYAVNPATLAYTAQESIAPLPGSGQALIYLDAFVQEVQAAEDPAALFDPALDNIDTTTRTRVAWRVRAAPVQATNCTDAAGALPADLISTGLLDIAPTTLSVPADPCAPPDDPRGKLPDGLLRVEVLDTGSETSARFAWSYEDGSAAVAATVAGTAVTLAPSPSVTFFQNDLVEVGTLVRRADRLANGPLFSVASVQPGAGGAVVTLSGPSTVTGAPSGLCLRRWDGQATGAAGGVAATLGGTDVGIAFTARPGTYLAGDWWVTRVRGSSADSVDPLTAAPPDGTQHYVAPLAVVDLTAQTVLSDCRPQFPSLTTVKGGCCTVEVQPSDVGGGASLHTLLANYANQGPVTFCLAPGTYTLSEPLVLSSAMSGVTLQGCSDGVVLQAPAGPGPQFTLGLIAIQGANSVTLRGLELSVPLVGFTSPANAFSGLPQPNLALLTAYATGLGVGIGVSAADATGLVIEDCAFSFPDPGQQNIYGAGIYAAGAIDDARVTGCTFGSANPPATLPFYDLTAGNQAEPPYQITFGYLQAADLPDPGPITTSAPVQATEAGAVSAGVRAVDEVLRRTGIAHFGTSQLLHDFTVEGCLFEGLTVPVFAMTQLGTLRIDKNTVRDSYGGFWFYSLANSSQLILFDQIGVGDPSTFQSFAGLGLGALCDRIAPIASALARVLPAVPALGAALVGRRIAAPSAAELTSARQYVTGYYARVRGPGAAEGAAPAAAAQAVRLPPRLSAALRLPPGLSTTVIQSEASAAEAIPPADPGTSVSPRLDVADCQVDAVIAGSYSGAALIMADMTQDPFDPGHIVLGPGPSVASAVVHGSRMRTRFPTGEAVMGFAFAQAVVSGNIIANEVAFPTQPSTTLPESFSLSLGLMTQPLGALAVAIGGNLLINPPPSNTLDTQFWQAQNTVVNYSQVPTVTGVNPPSGVTSGAQTITVTGTGFTAATAVQFGTTPATALTISSDTQLTVTSPAGTAGVVDVTVSTAAGTSAVNSSDKFTYVVPTIQLGGSG
jgi:IPT/TIG domain/Family of unknown function (DUF6519)